jgi:hypothetical protein
MELCTQGIDIALRGLRSDVLKALGIAHSILSLALAE